MVSAAEYKSAWVTLRGKGVKVFFEKNRRGGTIDGPPRRAYFRDPDGTALEFINRTALRWRQVTIVGALILRLLC